MKSIRWSLFAGLFCLALSSFAQKKPEDNFKLDELLKANSHALTVTNGNLSGVGHEFLLNATAATQFFVIAEPHNAREVPEITTLLFKSLHQKHGFEYLALEQDPVMAQMVSAPPVVGNRENVVSLARKYPNAFTFITDQELEMIAQGGVISKSKGNRIWGLDQVFGPIHVLDKLSTLAPNEDLRNRTLKLIDVLKQRESELSKKLERYTMAEAGQVEELAKLLSDYQRVRGAEVEFLVSQMSLSAQIFKNNQLAEAGQLTGYAANFEREENMKWLFMNEYRKAQGIDQQRPKVILKLGHYHAIRGGSWSNVLSLGNFLAEFAKSNNMNSFHLALYINNAAGDYGVLSSYADYKPFAEVAPTDKWTVIDLRPLRAHAHAGKLTGASSEMRRIIFGFDAALIIGVDLVAHTN